MDQTEHYLVSLIRENLVHLRQQSESQSEDNRRLLDQMEGLQGMEGKIKMAMNYSAIDNILNNSCSSFNQWIFQNDKYMRSQISEVISQNLSIVNN